VSGSVEDGERFVIGNDLTLIRGLVQDVALRLDLARLFGEHLERALLLAQPLCRRRHDPRDGHIERLLRLIAEHGKLVLSAVPKPSANACRVIAAASRGSVTFSFASSEDQPCALRGCSARSNQPGSRCAQDDFVHRASECLIGQVSKAHAVPRQRSVLGNMLAASGASLSTLALSSKVPVPLAMFLSAPRTRACSA
jgi:hypothetical protein